MLNDGTQQLAGISTSDSHNDISRVASAMPVGSNHTTTLNYSTSTNYNLAVAADLTGLAVAAYLTGVELEAQVANLGWTFIKPLKATSIFPIIAAQAVVVERTINGLNEMAIAHRGTAGGRGVLIDISHYGFLNYQALRPQIATEVISAAHQCFIASTLVLRKSLLPSSHRPPRAGACV